MGKGGGPYQLGTCQCPQTYKMMDLQFYRQGKIKCLISNVEIKIDPSVQSLVSTVNICKHASGHVHRMK